MIEKERSSQQFCFDSFFELSMYSPGWMRRELFSFSCRVGFRPLIFYMIIGTLCTQLYNS